MILALLFAADFYTQKIEYGAIPVRGDATVSSEAMQAAKTRLGWVLDKAPKIRASLEAAKFELHVNGLAHFASDTPEFRGDRGKRIHNGQLFDWHMIGGHVTDRFCVCMEATLRPIVGHRLFGDETCVHELGHAIDRLTFDAGMRRRIVELFNRSAPRWKGRYAATSAGEWFAEMTKYYFRPGGDTYLFYDPNLAEGRDWLAAFDPEAYAFVRDFYGGKIDPGTPKTVTLDLLPASAEATIKSKESVTPARVLIKNRTSQRLHAIWIDHEGKRDSRKSYVDSLVVAPGGDLELHTWATHPHVITDDSGRVLYVVIAAEDHGVVEIR